MRMTAQFLSLVSRTIQYKQALTVYSSSEVTEDNTLLVASLLLPVGIIRPCYFEPECSVELEALFSSETEKVHNHLGEKWRGNTTIVSTDIEVVITVLLEHMTVLSKANRSISFIPKFKHENKTKQLIDCMVY